MGLSILLHKEEGSQRRICTNRHPIRLPKTRMSPFCHSQSVKSAWTSDQSLVKIL